MVKRGTVMEREVRDRMRGGAGSVEILHVFRQDELGGAARLFARLRLPPGASIGHHVHEAVLAAGVKLSGATVHFSDETYDTGPIILQEAVPVLDDDTPDSLAARVQDAERRIYPAAIRLYAEGRLRREGRRVRILPSGSST